MGKKEKEAMRKPAYIKYIVVMLILLAAMISLITYYYTDMNKKLMDEARSNLKNTDEYKEQYFREYINGRVEWLQSIAEFGDVPDHIDDVKWNGLLQQYSSPEARMGIADTEGNLYFAEQGFVKADEYDFYEKVMQGENIISEVFKEKYTLNESIIIAVPIWRDQSVKGAVCMEYTTLSLGKLLNTSKMSKAGATMVFEEDGSLVASYRGMEKFDTVYDMLASMQYDDDTELDELKQRVEDKRSGFLTYYKNNETRLFYYHPLGINDWTICSLVVPDSEEKVLRGLKASFTAVFAGVIILVVLMLITGTQFVRHMRKNEKEMQMDFLTGSYNRATGKRIVERSLLSEYKSVYGAAMFIDIDNFKHINDTYGHDEGDRILINVSRTLKECTREQDVVSRFGGDEFIVWLYKVSDKKLAAEVAERILTKAEKECGVGLSIGITIVRPEESNYDEILKRADEALYEAKEKGKGRYAVYEFEDEG